VLVLDTQVYSNTGGQSSTATFTSQDAKMAAVGRTQPGKREHRKELGEILMMQPGVFVAETTAAHLNHFYKAIMAANEYPGPAVVICYSTCPPEHGVPDDHSMIQAKLAVDSRAFPLLIYDPRKGDRIRECLSLQGNPALKEDSGPPSPTTRRRSVFSARLSVTQTVTQLVGTEAHLPLRIMHSALQSRRLVHEQPVLADTPRPQTACS